MSLQNLNFKNERVLEFGVALAAAIVGSLGVWYIYSLGLITSLTDAHAHLNFSKMLFESLTPGVSQIGFWPPLLHVLMAPFTQIPSLYNSGLAGAAVLLPFYILGSLFSFKIVRLMTGNLWLSLLAAVLFMTNPYILYYTASPMMEVMFVANLIAVAYFVASWFKRGSLSDLVWMSLFVTLATLSRFEGIILIPLVGLILIASMIQKRRSSSHIQATALLFGMVAVIGAGIIMIYSWYFGGSPLAFTGGSWIKAADPNAGFTTTGNIISSLQYILHASYYMIGHNLMILGLMSIPFLLLLSKNRLETVSVLAVLASPVVFIAIALYSGSYNIALPELPPGNFFLNERYGLTWIGFIIIAPLLLLGYMLSEKMSKSVIRYAAVTTSVLVVLAMLYSTGDFLYTTAKQDKYFLVKNNINSPTGYQKDLAGFLNENYDFGKILLTRTDNDPVLGLARIDLDAYIYEANFMYFEQSLNEPWMFARWVVMHNRENGNDEWAQANERIAVKWSGNEQFGNFYELVYENHNREVYKIREDKVLEYARLNNLDISRIPSVNPNIAKWNPSDFYSRLQQQVSLDVKKN